MLLAVPVHLASPFRWSLRGLGSLEGSAYDSLTACFRGRGGGGEDGVPGSRPSRGLRRRAGRARLRATGHAARLPPAACERGRPPPPAPRRALGRAGGGDLAE